jgi:hypothetical protein
VWVASPVDDAAGLEVMKDGIGIFASWPLKILVKGPAKAKMPG